VKFVLNNLIDCLIKKFFQKVMPRWREYLHFFIHFGLAVVIVILKPNR